MKSSPSFSKFPAYLGFAYLFFLGTNGLFAQANTVNVYDQGMQMNICSYQVPKGWTLNQYISTNPWNVSDPFTAYFLEFSGPDMQNIRGLKPRIYNTWLGQSLDMVWKQSFIESYQETAFYLQLGPIQTNPEVLRMMDAKAYVGQAVGLERRVQGQLQGRQIEGVSYAVIMGDQMIASIFATVILSPQGKLDHALETYHQINASRKENFAYTMAINQVSQAYWTQSSTFQGQTKPPQDYSWPHDYDGSSSNKYIEDSYSSHDAFIDYLTESTTFLDPYSGQEVSQDGHFTYWYTNKLGDYYGTDDPSFNPYSLGSNWEEIKPLRP